MKENNIFNINRASYLLMRQARFNTSGLLIGSIAVAGLLGFIFIISSVFKGVPLSDSYFINLTFPFVFLGGYIFTSSIYSELHSPHRGYLLLSLPASTFEKLIIPWFITTFGYVLFSIVLLAAINLLVSSLIVLAGGNFYVVNLFHPHVLKLFGIYIITQSVFFLGASYFKGVNFLKTLLALFVIILIINIYTLIVAKIVFYGGMHSMNFNGKDFSEHAKYLIKIGSKIIFWYLMAPFFLTVSYFRLKERQV